MLTLIGLGNPGSEYVRTRHNVGFLVIDELAKRYEIDLRDKRAVDAELGEGVINDVRILLCKPQTYMNASGRTIQKLKRKYPLTPEQLVVIYDDADLSFGDVRLKSGGSSAGHRGIQSILEQFPAGVNIPRIRIGIGRPDHPDIGLEEYVLQSWSAREQEQLPAIIDRAITELTEHYARRS